MCALRLIVSEKRRQRNGDAGLIICWKWKTGEATLTKLRAQPSEARDAWERDEGLNITVCSESTDYILPLFMDSRCQSME